MGIPASWGGTFWGERVSRSLYFVQEWVFPFLCNTPFISLFKCRIIKNLTYTTSGRSKCIYSPFLMFSEGWLRRVQETGQFQGVSGPGTSSQLLMISGLWFKIKKIKLGARENSSQLHLVPSLSVFDHFLLVVGQFSYWEMYIVCRGSDQDGTELWSEQLHHMLWWPLASCLDSWCICRC